MATNYVLTALHQNAYKNYITQTTSTTPPVISNLPTSDQSSTITYTSLTVPDGVVTMTSITITPATVTVATAANVQLTATATYSDTTTANITNTVAWISSDTTKATVANYTNQGRVTGVAAGTATIEARYGSVSATKTVTVT